MAINQKTRALTFLGIAGIVALNAVSLFEWSSMQSWVSHTLQVQKTLSECLAIMSEMQEGRRGYIFRGDVSYKERYLAAKNHLNQTVQRVAELTKDNRGQNERAKELGKTFLELEKAYDEEVSVREASGMESAMVLVRSTNSNARIQNEIRKLVASAQNEESYLLEERTYKVFLWQVISGVAAAILGLITFVAVAYALRLLEREKSIEHMQHEQVMSHQREDFMAALAHNLKIPMLGIRQILTSILDGQLGEVNDEQKGLISLVRTTNEEQLVLINRLLNVYKYQESGAQEKRSEVQIADLIQQSITKFSQRATNQGVQVSSNTADFTFSCDPSAIQLLLENFLDNALRFTPSGGTVRIEASKSDSNLLLEVKDTGCGFDMAHKDAMFNTLWKGPAEKQYNPQIGLGLYLCKQIAETHGGTVSCESTLGKGATFSATLPCR